MKALVISIALLFVAGCASLPVNSSDSQSASTGGNTRYECSAYHSAAHVLTLPVPADGETRVSVELHGDSIEANYLEVGLMKNWQFTDKIFIRVEPDMSANYYDFTGADPGEQRTPEAMFECKRRN